MKSFQVAPLWTSPLLCSPRHALAAAWREPSRCAWGSLALSFVPVRSNSIRAHSPHRIDNCLRSSRPLPPARNGAEAFPFLPWNSRRLTGLSLQLVPARPCAGLQSRGTSTSTRLAPALAASSPEKRRGGLHVPAEVSFCPALMAARFLL